LSGAIVRNGDPIVVAVKTRGSIRLYYFTVYSDRVYSTIAGSLPGSRIVSKSYGSVIELADGEAYILKPTLRDLLENFYERVTQVIYPKDALLIALEADLKPGSRILEGGTGSGFLTTIIANIVCPQGRVYTYDIKPYNIEVAKRNILSFNPNLLECIEFKVGDIRSKIFEDNLDSAVLDIPDPWEALDTLWLSLKSGAPLIVFIPSMNQLVKLTDKVLYAKGWIIEKVIETYEREVEVTLESIRPSRISPFTGFIVVLRRVDRI